MDLRTFYLPKKRGPFNKYSTKLQSDEVTLADFFGYWTLLRIKLAKASPTDSFSSILLQRMAHYNSTLMENPLILAAMYLHPSHQRGLTDKKREAIIFLCNLHNKIKEVESSRSEREASDVYAGNYEGESDGELEEYLAACVSAAEINSMPVIVGEEPSDVRSLLEDFCGMKMPPGMTILQFWESKKYVMPVLYKLAIAVYSVSTTQASVERAFSTLPLIITSRRTKLNNDVLQNMLLIRLNRGVVCYEQE